MFYLTIEQSDYCCEQEKQSDKFIFIALNRVNITESWTDDTAVNILLHSIDLHVHVHKLIKYLQS